MMMTIAKITNRRPSPNANGSHICDVTCRACSKTITVSYGGWTALACTCGATIERNSATGDCHCDYCNDQGTKAMPCDACGEGRY
jgi:hypothetical protein